MIVSVSAPAFAATETLTAEEAVSLNLGRFWGNDAIASSITRLDTTPEKYLFKTNDTSDSKEYILLQNVNAGENDGYFVMVNTYTDVGSVLYNSTAEKIAFDNGYTGSIAYKMNQSAYIAEKFPLMNEYIKEHTWYTEPYDTEKTTAYKTTCKIALLSLTEYKLNADRIGIDTGYYSWWTRTPHTDAKRVWIFNYYNKAKVIEAKATGDKNANRVERPCFYLDESFFKNVKLDMTLLKTDGSAAAEVLKNIADTEGGLDALKKIYTAEELAEIGISGSVKITNATLAGTGNCGDTLVATAETDNASGNTSYEWIRDNADGTTTTLDCTANSYTVKFDDLGASIKCLVKVYDGEVLSDSKYTNAITTEAKPTFETSWNSTISKAVATTPDAYKFIVDKKEFILLNGVNSTKDDGQFVMLANSYDNTSLIWYENLVLTGDNATEFIYDPSDKNSIASKINNEYLNTIIPADMSSYVKSHRWWNEPIRTTSSGTVLYQKGAFATDSKLALLSYTEYVKNADRIGYTSLHESKPSLLRTPQFNWNGPKLGNPRVAYISYNENKIGTLDIGNATDKTKYGSYQAKSIGFYLSPSFFAEQKVDFTSANTEVIAILKEALKDKSASELAEMGYTAEQIGYISDAKIGKVAMYGFTKGDNGTITFTCKNMTSDAVSFIPAAAAYDNGAMVSVYVADTAVEIPAGETKKVTVTLSTSENAQIKVFAWDKTNLTPYAPVVEVK